MRVGRMLLRLLVGVVTVVAVAVAGVGWYFSGQVVAPSREQVHDIQVVSAVGSRVTLESTDQTDRPGLYAITWPDGYAAVGDVSADRGSSVTRVLIDGDLDELKRGVQVRWDPFVYRDDPATAFDLPFEEVAVRSDVGALPTWVVPPRAGTSSRTWVVAVHGRGADRREALRILPFLHGRGLPVVVPSYRNDVGAPASPDGHYHLGGSEWRDVDAAVGYALDHGARDVVLVGWSMGGAIALQAADLGTHRDAVRGIVLDSPVLDWVDVLDHQGSERDLPLPVTRAAQWFVEQRVDVDLDDFDWVDRAGELEVPVLVLHSPADTYVPWGPSRELAAARPDLVTLVAVPGAEHTEGWNVDQELYEGAVAQHLVAVGAIA